MQEKKESWIKTSENRNPGDSNGVYVKLLTCAIGESPDHLGKIPKF